MLPAPPQPFAGKIGETYADSVPAFRKPVSAPKGAPNVLLILTDDVGFGAASTFGGPVPTPNLDRLAARGLVYNRFHTTAMCSPTRASLLTGRNHHAVGNGIVANLSNGFPGYDNLLPDSAATIAEVLRRNGYDTAMVGKHHNTPEHQASPAGPFDLWPTGLGFEYFFGFMGAETNCYDNAPMESFFHTLKVELVHRCRWATQAQARQALFGYIEGYYNRHRMHSALGYLTPEQAEQRMTG